MKTKNKVLASALLLSTLVSLPTFDVSASNAEREVATVMVREGAETRDGFHLCTLLPAGRGLAQPHRGGL